MKKLICSIFLPLLAVFCLCGCGGDIKVANIKSNYSNLTTHYVTNNINLFFNDENLPNTITIYYPKDLQEESINNETPANDLQQRYRALYYQQMILTNIFDSYEKFSTDFYKIAESKNISQSSLKSLNSKERQLEQTLSNFKHYYDRFRDATDEGKSGIMTITITEYSYELNKVIEDSYQFVNEFLSTYIKCVDHYDQLTSKNVAINIAKANLDISYIVYLENIKSFNFTVGQKGMCDLAPAIAAYTDNNNPFVIFDKLSNPKELSLEVSENLTPGAIKYDSAVDGVNDFNYAKNIFEQRLSAYKNMYNQLDMYTLTQYRFSQINGVDYDNYVDSLNASKQSSVQMIESFVGSTLDSYINKLKNITK